MRPQRRGAARPSGADSRWAGRCPMSCGFGLSVGDDRRRVRRLRRDLIATGICPPRDPGRPAGKWWPPRLPGPAPAGKFRPGARSRRRRPGDGRSGSGPVAARLASVFTGIVEELGEVVGKDELGDSARFVIRGPVVTADARHGDSIAVNGVCLTVVEVLPGGQFSADVMAETLNRSSLAAVAVGSPVNLERAAALNSRLGGHIVQGHVDGRGTVISRTPSEHWEVVRIALPAELARYVVEKGSITVDGISLTVSGLGADWFEVSLIPTTLALTTLGRAPVGSVVNLEVDVIAKYVERLLAANPEPQA